MIELSQSSVLKAKGDKEMVKITNMFGDEYSGAVGKSGVFATWKGIQYRRKYAIPANPNTSKQVSVRTDFKNAVIEWHAYNSLQRAAFGYLASGKGMSGFNMLVQRWQKAYGTTKTVRPSYGMKLIGKALVFMDEAVVGAVSELTLPTFVATTHIISVDDATPATGVAGAVKNGTVATGVKAWVDLEVGQVRIITGATDNYYATYKYGGNQIIGELLCATGLTATVKTKYFPIDYGTFQLVDKATAPTTVQDAASVLAGEVSIKDGKLKTTYTSGGTTFTATSTVDYTKVEFLADAKVEVQKANSSFVAFRGYSGAYSATLAADQKGMVKLGLTAQDELYDTNITKTGYTAISKIAQAASSAAANESIIMSV